MTPEKENAPSRIKQGRASRSAALLKALLSKRASGGRE